MDQEGAAGVHRYVYFCLFIGISLYLSNYLDLYLYVYIYLYLNINRYVYIYLYLHLSPHLHL